ncbi:type VI secretion system Vgr family protein [Antarcticirhabdus aurantiaca]|uniref:Type VI secretion system tip protein TssI/VgrG n=1 Tax=Antarcticirhabdus aurantiaca TaxID=2606717 RepID=A0ACD4NJZ4_9HYPH|nr:type VI secretion system tip protein TssI/VgrG [Antarcticirhabdus aurantiaca]WAJ27165.1 type VI secretion system tip protein TssI/VgrG [Jeongeuplla avenae]
MNDVPVMNDFIQASRLLRIETPLGTDAFLMERFQGREAVNELFSFQAVIRAKRDDVSPQDLVGKNVQVSLDRGDEGPRRVWDGLVTNLTEEPRLTRSLRQYVLTLRPDLWLLSQRSDCRIWLNRTSLEIAETLLSEHGLRAPDASGVLSPPPARPYSVQWNETDLAFLLRRLEEDGLFFWVRQTDEGQVLALADGASGWDAGADGDTGAVRFAAGSTDRDHVSSWNRHFAFTPGRRAGRDWNFETPTTVPESAAPSLVKLPRNGAYELYEYPARALDNAASEAATKLRMQAVEADHERIEAASTTRNLAPGAKLTPYDVANPEHSFETGVVTAIEHFAHDTTYETGGDHPIYRNRFEALPARLGLTPHRTTPRPRIEGTQIAIVAGPPGEEIHTEEFGRVKLWFPWDRRARKDGSDTVWVRVGQSWGGGTWGSQIIPRIGMEVAVTFLDGDPDRPLVVGVVANPVNKVPYDLPANKTRMVLRSDSHKANGYNELSFEDEAGQENMFLHAQKDMTQKVLNNRISRVDAHQVESIGQNKSTDVGGNHQEKIGGSVNLSVGGGLGAPLLSMLGGLVAAGGTDSQFGSAAIDDPLLQAFTATVAAVGAPAEFASLGANAAVTAAGNFATKGGTESASAGAGLGRLLDQAMPLSGVMTTVVEKFRSDTVGMARTEQVGLYKNTTVGHTMTINAGEEFIIKCGQSRLIMDKDGNVTITGTKFNFAASGHVQINGEIIDLN